MAKDKGLTSQDHSLMSTTSSYKSYIKAVVGKVYVSVLSPFTGEIEGVILYGNPMGKDKESCIVDVWNEKEDMYFRRTNRRHFETGAIIAYERGEELITEDEQVNNLSNEELEGLLDKKFLTLMHAVNKMTSVAPVFRLIELAREKDKGQKTIEFLERKLAELQSEEYEVDTEASA